MTGLKSVHGGSIPPFLVNLNELGQRLALRMCGREEGIRGVIPRWSLLARLLKLLVWRQMLLR